MAVLRGLRHLGRLGGLSLVAGSIGSRKVFCAPLHSRDVGEGEVVVLLHGLDSWSGTWHGFMAALAQRGFRTVALDLRGHGESPLGDPKAFAPEQLAKDVRSTLQALGLSQITLLGHSMGGRVALQYAADYPEDLKLLVIEDMVLWRPL